VPHDLAQARIAAAIDAGGHLVTDKYAPAWWVLADAEGNEACVGTWMGATEHGLSSICKLPATRDWSVDMAEVLLFHHIQGLTSGVVAFADELRGAGHIVHTPDLFDGRTFDSIEQGSDFVQEIGCGEVIERGVRAAEDLPEDLVYAGISLGVMPAQKLAQTRPGAQGALLFESCAPPSEFGSGWPDGVPVQVHGRDADPFFADEGDIDAARALVEEVEDGELFVYPGNHHLFADSSLPSYDAKAAALLTQRVLEFLSTR